MENRNPRVMAWMTATGERTLDGIGHRYIIWISGMWQKWLRLQNRPENDHKTERDHREFDAWLAKEATNGSATP
jgi:hypothetical protein